MRKNVKKVHIDRVGAEEDEEEEIAVEEEIVPEEEEREKKRKEKKEEIKAASIASSRSSRISRAIVYSKDSSQDMGKRNQTQDAEKRKRTSEAKILKFTQDLEKQKPTQNVEERKPIHEDDSPYIEPLSPELFPPGSPPIKKFKVEPITVQKPTNRARGRMSVDWGRNRSSMVPDSYHVQKKDAFNERAKKLKEMADDIQNQSEELENELRNRIRNKVKRMVHEITITLKNRDDDED